MIDSDSDALSGVGSDEEARPLNTAEEQAAKRAKLPVVNPFDLMQERRMSSHRTSATSGETEGPAAEEPEEPEEPTEDMPIMAAIERDRQTKLKKATKTGGHTSGPRKSTEPQISVDTRVREYPGQGFAKVLGKLRCRCCKKDLPVIKSTIDSRIKTGKHISNLEKQEASDKSDKAFSKELTDYYSQHVDEKGANISPATHLARFHAVHFARFRLPREPSHGPVPGTVRLHALLRHLSGTPALRPVVRCRARSDN